MPARRRSTRRKPSRRHSGVIDVRSPGSIGKFENLLSKGPLTLVLIYADWCGACHRFRDEVWSPLTSLQNATINRAAVRDDMVAKTSLANVEKKFYPTLLLVGSDKKPATFPSEDGGTTNAMPRKPTLEEDREALTTLVNSPSVNNVAQNLGVEANLNVGDESSLPPPTMSIKPEPEVARSITPGRSPFENQEPSGNLPEEVATEVKTIPGTALNSIAPSLGSTLKMNSVGVPPDIGSDLMASQNKAKTGTQAVLTSEPQKGGRMLTAIRRASASLRAMINLRQNHMRTRKNRRNRKASRRNRRV